MMRYCRVLSSYAMVQSYLHRNSVTMLRTYVKVLLYSKHHRPTLTGWWGTALQKYRLSEPETTLRAS